MNINETDLFAYMNDIVFGFYEDEALVASIGKKQFGIDIDKDYFCAVSFLYPGEVVVDYDMKQEMRRKLEPLVQLSPANAAINSKQFLLAGKGVVLMLVNSDKDAFQQITKDIADAALKIFDESFPDDFLRVGIGTIENGTEGITTTYQNALNAVIVGEKFKKQRRVLDYIGMEIYSAINAMVLAKGYSLIGTILKQLTEEEQTILGKYYKCKEVLPDTAASLGISEEDVLKAFAHIKSRTGLDVNDTEDNFKLNFIMIAKRVLEKEKMRKES
jgi:sugar diacid utilization regulator